MIPTTTFIFMTSNNWFINTLYELNFFVEIHIVASYSYFPVNFYKSRRIMIPTTTFIFITSNNWFINTLYELNFFVEIHIVASYKCI